MYLQFFEPKKTIITSATVFRLTVIDKHQADNNDRIAINFADVFLKVVTT